MKLILILLAAVAAASARPEFPKDRAFRQEYQPAARHQQFPRQAYGPPPGPPGPPFPAPPGHNQYGPPPPPPIVTKNVYVHLPPEDEAEVLPPQVIPQQAPKKHYKLIFIKAPEPPKYVPPVLPQTSLDEHKTLVYVLVKKPDEQPQLEIPAVVPTEPSKPEVYFIKYKGQKEAAAAPYPAAGPPPPPGAGPPVGPPIPPSYGAPAPPNVDFGPIGTY